jgi:hypothetical protein
MCSASLSCHLIADPFGAGAVENAIADPAGGRQHKEVKGHRTSTSPDVRGEIIDPWRHSAFYRPEAGALRRPDRAGLAYPDNQLDRLLRLAESSVASARVLQEAGTRRTKRRMSWLRPGMVVVPMVAGHAEGPAVGPCRRAGHLIGIDAGAAIFTSLPPSSASRTSARWANSARDPSHYSEGRNKHDAHRSRRLDVNKIDIRGP